MAASGGGAMPAQYGPPGWTPPPAPYGMPPAPYGATSAGPAATSTFTLPGGFLGTNGLAYLPEGPPEPAPADGAGSLTTTHFTGPRYRFSRMWD
jgi:hypothetical protein